MFDKCHSISKNLCHFPFCDVFVKNDILLKTPDRIDGQAFVMSNLWN